MATTDAAADAAAADADYEALTEEALGPAVIPDEATVPVDQRRRRRLANRSVPHLQRLQR